MIAVICMNFVSCCKLHTTILMNLIYNQNDLELTSDQQTINSFHYFALINQTLIYLLTSIGVFCDVVGKIITKRDGKKLMKKKRKLKSILMILSGCENIYKNYNKKIMN